MVERKDIQKLIQELGAPFSPLFSVLTVDTFNYFLGSLMIPLYRKRSETKSQPQSFFYNYFDVLLALSRNSLIQIGGRKYKEIDLKKVNVHFAIEQLRINDFKKRNFDFVRVANLDSKVLLAAYIISSSGKRFYDRRIKPGKLKREFVVAKSVKKDSKRKSDD